MNARTMVAAAVAAAMMAMTVSLFAAEQAPAPRSGPIYGYSMMSGQDCPGPGAGRGPGPRP